MAEYAGYVRRETPIDWNSVAGDIVNQLGDVKKDQAAFREKYDKIAAETSAKIGEYEAGQSPQVNDLAYNMISDGRTTLAALHEKLKRREISPDAFNRAAMSMQTQNQEFKSVLSTYNTNVADIEKGIQEGGLSNLSNFQLEQYKDLSELGNKKFQWSTNPDGITNLYVNTVDEEGNPVKQPMSLSVIRDMGNMRYAKYDLNGELLKSIKSLGIYDIKNIRDARDNPEYENFKQTLVKSAVATDNQTASILADYGDYVPYKEGDEVPENGIEMVLQSNGQYEPKITPELKTKAEEIINESIEARVGRTETDPKDSSTKPPTPKYKPEDISLMTTGHEVTRRASTGRDFTGMDTENYTFTRTGEGIEIRSKDYDEMLTEKPLPYGTEETQRILSKYTEEFRNQPQGSWDFINDKLKKQTVPEGSQPITGDIPIEVKEKAKDIEPYKPSQKNSTAIEKIFNNDMDVRFTATNSDKRTAIKSLSKFLEPLVGEGNLLVEFGGDNNISIKVKNEEVGIMDIKDGSMDDLKKIVEDAVNKSRESTEFTLETASDTDDMG